MEVKKLRSSEGNVWKYVFEFKDAIAEAVLYKYGSFDERTVICCSVQSGCPVGCTFCGTGNGFIRNLHFSEILDQVNWVLNDNALNPVNIEKFQIMFMSMGEPFLNYINVERAIRILHNFYGNAQLLVSTIAPERIWDHEEEFIALSKEIDKVGLQFSVHRSNNHQRSAIIPFKRKLTLEYMHEVGVKWWKATGRMPYCNYIIDGTNNKDIDFMRLHMLFPPEVFCFTFSVLCSPDEKEPRTADQMEQIKSFNQRFIESGYNTRIFDPAGQDDIGGGCGQLWYVQEFLKRGKK